MSWTLDSSITLLTNQGVPLYTPIEISLRDLAHRLRIAGTAKASERFASSLRTYPRDCSRTSHEIFGAVPSSPGWSQGQHWAHKWSCPLCSAGWASVDILNQAFLRLGYDPRAMRNAILQLDPHGEVYYMLLGYLYRGACARWDILRNELLTTQNAEAERLASNNYYWAE